MHPSRSANTSSPFASFVPALVVRRFGAGAASPEVPEAETLTGAVLFADISGFTALAERLAERGPRGAEELTTLLNEYFGHLIALIREHGGEVVKFAGDALLALWRAGDEPLADATRRATQCATVVPSTLAMLAERDGVKLTLRIGIGAGDVHVLFVGHGRRWECIPAGAPLTQMAVAEREAQRGEVVLSPEAWALVADVCDGTPRAEGCVRLDAVRTPLSPRAAAPLAAVAHDEGLAAFVSGAIRARLAAGQTEWLSELRRVTVLFVNLLGLDGASPEFLGRVQTAFATMQATLDHFEGSIDKVSVDDKGVVALAALGLPPLAHEDDAIRGVQAAMALHAALAAHGQPSAIGVATGRVFCGVVGSADRREYTVVGDPVNLGARLMQRAAGAILCDGATSEAAGTHVAFEALPPVPMKGKARPVPVFAPRGDSRPTGGARVLVGRIRERASLAAAVETVVRGESQAILLEGDPGVGKSRLVVDFLEKAAAHGVACLKGAGDSIDRGTPYHAWRPVVGRLLGLDRYEPADREGRRAHLLRLAEDDPTLAERLPLLRDIVGLELADNELTAAMAGEVRAHNTQDLLVHLLRRGIRSDEGPAQPLAVVLEDAHWFDSASWALLRQVHEAVGPLALLVAARPIAEPLPAEYTRLRDTPATVRMHLTPLDLAETRDLVAQRLGQPPSDELAELIFARAEGNPFFTEELAAALLEAGVLRPDDGVLRLAPEASEELSLPDTVQGTILARIDRLDPRQQLMVKVASVIGRTFGYAVLSRVYPVEGDRPQIGEKLHELVRLGLTEQEAPDPDPTYVYKHETTREVAYGLLLYSQRQKLHRDVAETLEAIETKNLAPLYPRLAYHWARADEPGKTLHYLEKAGDQALLEGAYREAAAAFREALRLHATTDGADAPADRSRRAHWERQLGEAQLGLGNLPESRAALERAVALLGFPVPTSMLGLGTTLARGLGRQLVNRVVRRPPKRPPADEAILREAALAYLRLLETYFFLAGTAETFNATIQALNIAEAAGPSPELARAYALTAWIVSMVPQFTLSDLYLRLARELVEAPEGRSARQPVQFFTGFCRVAAGRFAEGNAALEEAVQLAERLGDKRRWIEGVCGHSTLLHYQGQFARRVQMGANVLYTSARRQGDFQAEAWGLLDQIESLLPLGEHARAMALVDALRPFLDKDIGRSEQVWGHGLTAATLLSVGRRSEALAAALRANTVSARIPPVAVYCFEGYAGAADVLLTLAEEGFAPTPGVDLVRSAREATVALATYARVFPIARPRTLLAEGRLAWLAGRRTRALSAWRESSAAAARFGMPYDEGLALLAIGQHLAPADPARHDALIRAEALFARLGAANDLARTRQALGRQA